MIRIGNFDSVVGELFVNGWDWDDKEFYFFR